VRVIGRPEKAVIDCPDPRALAEFYCQVLGIRINKTSMGGLIFRVVALIWWSSGRGVVRSVSRSAAGLAAKRTPAPGQAAGAVDLSGVPATAGRVRVRMPGVLAFQRLAELALDLFLGTFRLRRGVSHTDLLRDGHIYSFAHVIPAYRLAGWLAVIDVAAERTTA
jgi:Glyoxalase-like domain